MLIRGIDELTEGLTFTLENVNSIEEIAGTNLTYVPVVFVVENNILKRFRRELTELLVRKDVEQKQLFFYISPSMDQEYVIRFIQDLGVKNPHVISRLDDGNIATYIKNYPMIVYVREVIQTIEKK